jgi:hypothetical protein
MIRTLLSLALAAALALVVAAPAQAASYKPCQSFVAPSGFPYYAGVKAKR